MTSVTKKVITGIAGGSVVGMALFAVFGLANAATGAVIVEPTVGLAMGTAAGLTMQLVTDLDK